MSIRKTPQQVADLLRQATYFSEQGFRALLNGGQVLVNLTDITSIWNVAVENHRVETAPDDLTMVRRVEHAGTELAESRELVKTLRENITRNIADNEKADKDAYAVQLVKDQLVAALKDIASLSETGANEHLKITGSYGRFDYPGAVETARDALAAAGVKL